MFYNSAIGAGTNGLGVKIANPAAAALDVSQGTAAGTAGTPLLRVNGNDRVGIGTSAPRGTLDVAGGIIPGRVDGLDGVLFSPFLHDGWDHLYGNAVPLILVGTFALAGGARRFIWSTLTIMLVSGLGVWFTGDPGTVVVGASGVIFGYLGLLFARGFVERAGFVPVMFCMLLVLMLVNRVRPVTALLVALAGSVGVAFVFVRWLGVFLPSVPYGLLGAIGL